MPSAGAQASGPGPSTSPAPGRRRLSQRQGRGKRPGKPRGGEGCTQLRPGLSGGRAGQACSAPEASPVPAPAAALTLVHGEGEELIPEHLVHQPVRPVERRGLRGGTASPACPPGQGNDTPPRPGPHQNRGLRALPQELPGRDRVCQPRDPVCAACRTEVPTAAFV